MEHVAEYVLDWIQFEPASGVRSWRNQKSVEFINEVGGTRLILTCGTRNLLVLQAFINMIERDTPASFPDLEYDFDDYLKKEYPWEDVSSFKDEIFNRFPNLK